MSFVFIQFYALKLKLPDNNSDRKVIISTISVIVILCRGSENLYSYCYNHYLPLTLPV